MLKKILNCFVINVYYFLIKKRGRACSMIFFYSSTYQRVYISWGWIYWAKYRSPTRTRMARFIVPLSFVFSVFHYLNYGNNSVRVQKVHTTSNLAPEPGERNQKRDCDGFRETISTCEWCCPRTQISTWKMGVSRK